MKITASRGGIGSIIVCVMALVIAACTPVEAQPPQEWVDTRTKDMVGEQMKIYMEGQPVPRYEFSAQRETLIDIYNATVPENRPSWHVFSTPGVGATDVCAGVGSPIPFGVSLTSPEYKWRETAMPLSEPPGYYINNITTDATWVLCDFGNGIEPVYSEDIVRTYFHPVKLDGNKVVHEKVKPSIVLDQGK